MTSFAFGRGTGGGPRSIPLELAPALPANTALAVQAQPFVREDGLQIDRDAVHAWAVVTDGGRADLTVCVDDEALGSDPGTYRGGVLISDSRVQLTVVAVSLRTFPSLWWMSLAFVGICLIGSLYIYALRRPTLPEDLQGHRGLHADNPSILRPSEFWLGYGMWATRLLGISTIISGGGHRRGGLQRPVPSGRHLELEPDVRLLRCCALGVRRRRQRRPARPERLPETSRGRPAAQPLNR